MKQLFNESQKPLKKRSNLDFEVNQKEIKDKEDLQLEDSIDTNKETQSLENKFINAYASVQSDQPSQKRAKLDLEVNQEDITDKEDLQLGNSIETKEEIQSLENEIINAYSCVQSDQPSSKRAKLDFEVNQKQNEGKENVQVEISVKIKEESQGLEAIKFIKDITAKTSDDITNKMSSIDSNENKVSASPKIVNYSKVFENKRGGGNKYPYGNYRNYFGYRNKDHVDCRLKALLEYKYLFEGKNILDIGCNSGVLTRKIARDTESFNIKCIQGIDIDKSLISEAEKYVVKIKRQIKWHEAVRSRFPFNIKFVHGNYVLKNDVLLEIEQAQFDLILCLSVTKWIQLNFGDKGLKQAFKRMFLQIRSGGYLLLEPQAWKSYKARRKLTPEIFQNYKNIKFFPNQFETYLLGPDVGFSSMKVIEVAEHDKINFRRPMYLFYKK